MEINSKVCFPRWCPSVEKRQAVLETWLRNNPQGTNRKGPRGSEMGGGEGLAKEMPLKTDSNWWILSEVLRNPKQS